jgi:hypothetical protein
MHARLVTVVAASIALVALGATASDTPPGKVAPPKAPPATAAPAAPGAPAGKTALNALTPEERAGGWMLLFDGTNPGAHLRAYKGAEFPEAWKVEDGAIVLRGKVGDLVTREQWENFEFQVDWNVEPGGNSGIMYRVTEDCAYPWETGQEMQILDDARHVDGKNRLTSAGSCYALYAAPEGVVHPAGEWNTARIVAVGPKLTYFLNGTKVVEFDMTSADYKERLAKSKFATMPNFGTRAKGHIALQDHGDVVRFRNMKVRPLDSNGQPVRPGAPAATTGTAAPPAKGAP